MKIAVVAPSCRLKPETADAVAEIVARRGDCEVVVHSQCFLSDGHFAGSDDQRLGALREMMADPSVDAVWFARGGYGSNRIAEAAVADLPEAARGKTYLGYSDAGFLLAAFYRAGLKVAHGPMPQDVLREGGAGAVGRALDWLVRRDPAALEPGLVAGRRAMAFNLKVLTHLLGTAIEPDFAGAELLIEDVSEYDYGVDRMMFHLVGSASARRCAGLRLGRFSDTPDNDPPFGRDTSAIVEEWCARGGIAFNGTADIGHDAANRVVPFSVDMD